MHCLRCVCLWLCERSGGGDDECHSAALVKESEGRGGRDIQAEGVCVG